VAAAILINLSIYIVGFSIDVTNVLGRGLSGLIYAPFGQQNWHFKLSGTVSGLGLAAIFGGTGGIFALATIGAAGTVVSFLALFVLLPAVVAALGVFVTIIIREGLIIFLAISSPVAFVLYCLPNTEKYFRQWWSLLLKTLMVYPIIMLVFAVTDVLAVTINAGSNGGATATSNTSVIGWMTDIVSILLVVLPLFLIPYAFKMAGGAIGSIHSTLQGFGKKTTEAIKGNPNDPNSLRNRTRRNAGAGVTRARAQFVRSSGTYDANSSHGRLRKRLGGIVGYGNIFDKEAALNKTAMERLDTVRNNGDDTFLNAISAVQSEDGRWYTIDGGAEVSGAAVKKALQLHPTMGDLQASIGYRLGKTNTAESAQAFKRNLGKLQKQRHLANSEVTGLATGVGFAHQNERLEFKHASYGEVGPDEVAEYGATPGDRGYLAVTNPKMNDPTLNPQTGLPNSKNDGFVNELDNIRGTWSVSQMRDTTIRHEKAIQSHWEEQYRNAADGSALKGILRDRLQKVYRTGDSLSPRVTSGATGATPLDSNGQPVEGFGGVSGAAPAVRAAVEELVSSRDNSIYSEIMGRGGPAPGGPAPGGPAPGGAGPAQPYSYP
jgi:hypothetical protein